MNIKFNNFVINETDAESVSINFNSNIVDSIIEVEGIFNTTLSPCETNLSIDNIFVIHNNNFDNLDQIVEIFLGFNGNNFYLQIFFVPSINSVLENLVSLIKINLDSEKLNLIIKSFEQSNL